MPNGHWLYGFVGTQGLIPVGSGLPLPKPILGKEAVLILKLCFDRRLHSLIAWVADSGSEAFWVSLL